MRFEFDRTTLIFVIFIVVIAAVFGINQILQQQPPFEITLVTDPLAEDWITDAAQQYNSNNVIVNNTVRVQVNVQVLDDLDIWRTSARWTGQNHPHMWLPSSSLSLDFAPASLSFETVDDSLARSYLVWGGFQNRVDVITGNGVTPLDWDAVQASAANVRWDDGSFVNMAINWPTASMSGISALLSAAADYADTTTVNRGVLSDAGFTGWFQPIEDSVLNSQRLSGNPADAMAARGTSAADFALLTEAQWLTALSSLTNNNEVMFSYANYQLPLDFPLAMWRDAQTTSVDEAAVNSFVAFLADEGQSIAIEHGLRPAEGNPEASASLFTRGEAYGIMLDPPVMQIITPPDRSTVDALIGLLN